MTHCEAVRLPAALIFGRRNRAVASTGGFLSPAFAGWIKMQTGNAGFELVKLGIVLLAGTPRCDAFEK
jgi:hypothetical protein